MVDPATGLPMGDQFTPQTRGASMIGGAAQNAGFEMPLFYDLLESVPALTTTTAWNMRRVSNTLLSNRRSSRTAPRGIRQTFSPLRFNSLASVSNVSPGMGSRVYSPFNFLAPLGNKFFDPGSRVNQRLVGLPKVGGAIQGGLNAMTGGPLSAGQEAFSRGTLGRFATAARISDVNPYRYADNLMGSVSSMNPAIGGAMRRQFTYGNYNYAERAQLLRTGVGMTNAGVISGRVTGFMQGMESGVRGTAHITENLMMRAPTSAYTQGAKSGISFASKAPGIARAASLGARFGSRAIPVAGQLMLAYDIGSLAGKIVNRSAKLAVDGIKSAQGDLNRSWGFGSTYQDNPVAATSRARAVNQIASSRLNARSMLGSEAALVASRYQ